MPRKAANTASADDMVSNYEPCYHSLLFLSHPLYFSQYLSSMEMESIQHLQCWFYFDMLATVNISFLVLIYYFDFSPMISLSGYNVSVCVCVCVCVCVHAHTHTSILSCVQLFVTPCSVACQAPLYWSGLPFPPPGDLSHSRTEPLSLAPPALAGRFFTTESPGEPFKGQPPCKHFLASEYCSPVNGT